MRISSRVTHKQDELVEEAEGQRGTATYTEGAAAKTNLDDGAKERWCLPPWPWAWVTLGVCVAVSGSAHRQCPSSKQSRGSQIQPQGATCSCCTEMYSLNSIVFDFSCQNCSRCEFCLRTRQGCAGGAAGFATRCKAGLGPCPMDFRCHPLLS